MVRSLFGVIGCDTVPLKIRTQIAFNVNFILKNLTFKRFFTEEPLEAHTTLRSIYTLMIESFDEEKVKANGNKLDGLYYECVNILITILSMDFVKFYFPGETLERQKIKQRGQDAGILIMVTFIMINTKNENLKGYIDRELFNKINLKDLEYYFEYDDLQYQITIDLVYSSKQ